MSVALSPTFQVATIKMLTIPTTIRPSRKRLRALRVLSQRLSIGLTPH
ncbi:hypothetical protein KDI_03640 [Dictyobacter arantiisoli]|uniref:Uncharacterized protein n=1 Tax=Dictyobacter arantiisoli TaxID=2014874 RepID=A0A5A5T5U1_9CHLR|nr:hypothetical protein KDI_03640 [Dictyobacter arantiisoli]